MACFEHGKIVELKTRETVTLPDVKGATLRVARGTVWITQEDDTQDVVLRSGDTWTIERNGLTILEAQGEVSLCFIGRRVERLFAVRGRPVQRYSPWTWIRDAIAAFFATPTRTITPYV
jgi:Protein of unknown function (DUF2917)